MACDCAGACIGHALPRQQRASAHAHSTHSHLASVDVIITDSCSYGPGLAALLLLPSLTAVQEHAFGRLPGIGAHIVLEQSFRMLVECWLVVHAGVKKKCRNALLSLDACMFVGL